MLAFYCFKGSEIQCVTYESYKRLIICTFMNSAFITIEIKALLVDPNNVLMKLAFTFKMQRLVNWCEVMFE